MSFFNGCKSCWNFLGGLLWIIFSVSIAAPLLWIGFMLLVLYHTITGTKMK